MAVIFARFSDDDAPHPVWTEQPDARQPENVPPWMRTFIDAPEATELPSNSAYENITHYFYTASQGRLKLYGDVYHVEIPARLREASLAASNRKVMQQLFGSYDEAADAFRAGSAELPAAAYDRWSPLHISATVPEREQRHVSEQDGIFDYALIIYRHRRGQAHPFAARWNAIASLGGGRPYALGDSTLVYGSGRRVSGASVLFSSPRRTAEFIYHEMAHHLLGAPHPYKGNTGAHPAYWGLFNSYLSNQSINAWEREALGWGKMERPDFSRRTDTPAEPITLRHRDFITQGDAVAFGLPGAAEEQLLVFENRQRHHEATGAGSTYDNATLNSSDKGLFIYTVRPPYSSRNHNLRTFPADGHHVWDISDWGEACGEGNLQPVLRKAAPHPQGVSYRDVFVIPPDMNPRPNPADSLFSLFVTHEAPGDCRSYTRGEYHDTAFGPESRSGKRWFSAFTNPGSLLDNGAYTGISAYVHGQDAGELEVSYAPDPFLAGLGQPLELNQDIFFYPVPGAVNGRRIVIPEHVRLKLGADARIFLDERIELDIRGHIVTAKGDTLTGKQTPGSLKSRAGFPAYELSPFTGAPSRAAF